MKQKQQPSIETPGAQPERIYPATELGKLLGTDDVAEQVMTARNLLQIVTLPDVAVTILHNQRANTFTFVGNMTLSPAQLRAFLAQAQEALVKAEIEAAQRGNGEGNHQ